MEEKIYRLCGKNKQHITPLYNYDTNVGEVSIVKKGLEYSANTVKVSKDNTIIAFSVDYIDGYIPADVFGVKDCKLEDRLLMLTEEFKTIHNLTKPSDLKVYDVMNDVKEVSEKYILLIDRELKNGIIKDGCAKIIVEMVNLNVDYSVEICEYIRNQYKNVGWRTVEFYDNNYMRRVEHGESIINEHIPSTKVLFYI